MRPRRASELIETMADPKIRIVSLTVTEKGYCHDPATGELDAGASRHPPRSGPSGEPHQRTGPDRPGTGTPAKCGHSPVHGSLLRQSAVQRRDRGARRSGLRRGCYNPSLADHIATNVAFPSTMVDRIVPATTEEDRQLARSVTGLDDAWPVMTEPFTQWVIEDHFTAGRPRFEDVGVEMVADVEAVRG